ncbi:MAG: response regulator [Archangium sp.]|nr:response regulator [Archangium sp.]
MAQARKILIADPDVNAVRPLTKALRQRGYHVQYAPDGSRALEVAVLRHPDVILFDENCRLIEARSFVQILLTNPRTDDIPVVVTTSSRELDRFRTFRDGALQKPFNLDEVLSRIDHLCRRVEAARDLKGDAREIEGGLSQLPLPDLLQILAMNRRTGRLTLANGAEKGEIQLSSGQPVNARVGEIEGEKALFRLIAWREGTFAFVPGPAPLRALVNRAMEDVLLEGMRQSDERERLLADLPPIGQLLQRTPDAADLVEPHPVTAEVLQLLRAPRRISEVLDLTASPDLEVLSAIGALLQRGIIERVAGAELTDGPLLGAAEVHALRGRLMRGRSARTTLVTKVVVCGSGSRAGRWLLKALPGVAAVSAEPQALRSSFGTLGRLDVSDVLRVDLIVVPTAEAARPLWRPFISGAVGAILLEESETAIRLARYCAFELRLPIVIAAKAASHGMVSADVVPPPLRGAPMGAAVVSSDISSVMRTVLLAALQSPPPEVPETVVSRFLGLA